MGRAAQMIRRRRKAARTGPAPEKWIVEGIDGHGEPYSDYGDVYDGPRTLADAEASAARVNRRGGQVSVKRLVWDSPAAAYREPEE